MKINFAPLVSCIADTPRKLILVDRECADDNHGCMDCDTDAQAFAKSSKIFVREYNFHIVRRVCFQRVMMKEIVFRELVYDNYDPKDVVVIFNSWGGVSRIDLGWRVGLTMKRCHGNRHFNHISFSQTIIKDASKYVKKYMSTSVL